MIDYMMLLLYWTVLPSTARDIDIHVRTKK